MYRLNLNVYSYHQLKYKSTPRSSLVSLDIESIVIITPSDKCFFSSFPAISL